MSEENKDLGDKAEDALDKAKETAKETFDDVKEETKEFVDSAKEVINSQDNKKMLAGLLGIFLGGLGAHKFILGYKKEGIILLSITLIGIITSCIVIGAFFVWIPGAIGLIEGIIYITKSDEEFFETYQANQKPWF